MGIITNNKMKIRTRLFITFFLSAVVLISLSIGAVTFFANDSLKNAVIGQIESTAASRANHVNNFIAERRNEIVTLEDNHHIIDFSMEYWRQQNENIENLWEPLEEGVNLFDHTQAALRALQRNDLEEVSIINNEGVVILSSNNSVIGEDRSGEKYFINAESAEKRGVVYIEDVHKKEDGSVAMSVSIPFYRPDTEEFFGVLVKEFGIDDLNVIVSDVSGLGETGEVYIVNKEGIMITESRFMDDVVLVQDIDSKEGAHTCFYSDNKIEEASEHSENILQIFDNYRGERSIGTHRTIEGAGWCLIVEVGSNEAFVSSNRIRGIGGIVLVIALVSSLFVANFVGGIVGRPVEDLRNDIKIIESGDLEHKIYTERSDEIGELGEAYNKMVESLKNSKRDVEKEIEQHTRNLKEKQAALLAQNKELLKLKKTAEEDAKDLEKRKKELQIALDEASKSKEALEKMNELMVGREMKMIELKERLSELSENAEANKNKADKKKV